MQIHYKLRILGVTIDRPDQIMGDNESVVTSCSVPSSTSKKKQTVISYHPFRESVATGVMRMEHVPGNSNSYNILTNPLVTQKHHPLMKEFLV